MAAAHEERVQRTLQALADDPVDTALGQRHDRHAAADELRPLGGATRAVQEPGTDAPGVAAHGRVSNGVEVAAAALSSSPAMSGRDVSAESSLNILPGDSVSQQRLLATPVRPEPLVRGC